MLTFGMDGKAASPASCTKVRRSHAPARAAGEDHLTAAPPATCGAAQLELLAVEDLTEVGTPQERRAGHGWEFSCRHTRAAPWPLRFTGVGPSSGIHLPIPAACGALRLGSQSLSLGQVPESGPSPRHHPAHPAGRRGAAGPGGCGQAGGRWVTGSGPERSHGNAACGPHSPAAALLPFPTLAASDVAWQGPRRL